MTTLLISHVERRKSVRSIPQRLRVFGLPCAACLAATSQFYWSGPSFDVLARDYIAMVLSAEFNQSIDKANVIGVTAEEATGVTFAVERYLSDNNTPVPLLLLRGNSDISYLPLAVRPTDQPWMESTTFNANNADGESFCYAGFTAAVFNLFAARCKASQGNSSQCLPSGRINFVGSPASAAT